MTAHLPVDAFQSGAQIVGIANEQAAGGSGQTAKGTFARVLAGLLTAIEVRFAPLPRDPASLRSRSGCGKVIARHQGAVHFPRFQSL